ncbi:mycolipanoate synthase [Penicillium ochrochloron]
MLQPISPGSSVPIAICGMGMRLPGGIHHEEELYNFLIEQKDARSIVPPNRYNVDAHFSPHGKKGTVITRHGYFLDADLANFDPTTFKTTATEASHLDPNQRLSLEVVREALESAGEINWRGKKIGTYVGLFGEDWKDMRQKDASFNSSYGLIGALDYAIANRISYEYDLKGPSVMVKTACSSAAVGLHEAMQEIQRGNITSAIVAGANLIFAPGMTVAMSIQAALSPEGSSKSFDAAADGYARGEAVTAIYIKRLDEAIRDGNPIRAILRASSSNSDGRTLGFSTPNADSHEAAMREAYSIAGLDFSQTAMVEAHGTGTATGDPIEAEAIARCFGEEGVYIGAVKPNLGHSEGAAALTSLIKAVVSLEHQTIIPNIKFQTPNPAIPWETAKLQVPVKVCPWPKDRAERMSVNSFGIGGSNVHGKEPSGPLNMPPLGLLKIGLVDLLEAWGVKPFAVVGHSSGEIAASYSTRSLTKTEAITIAFYRGHVCKNPPQKGGMAAVGLGKAQVAAFLLPGVSVACENSPSSVTLAGNVDALETVMAKIKKANEDTFVRRLKVEMAYHSDHMRDLGDKYHDLVAPHLDPRPPRVPFYSSAYGGTVLSEASQFGPHYWQENLENPVLFNAAVKSMVSITPELVLLEVGPHSSLRGALSQITQPLPSTVLYVPTLVRGKNDTESFLSTIGQLFTAGVDIRAHSDPTDAIVLPDLPTYPFHYEKSYWVDSRVMSNWRFPKHLPHDLLGIRTLEGTDMVPTWRNNLQLYELPWLRDHRVGKDIVFPAACYIALAGEAAFQLTEGDAQDYTAKSVDLHQALLLQEDAATEIVTTLRPQRLTTSLNSDWYEFLIVSHDGETWKKHCSGLVRIGRASTPPPAFKKVAETLPRKVSSTRWYETGARVGLNYGPCFTGLQKITAGVTETKSAADIIDKPETASESIYPLHPITLDLAFQALTVAIFKGDYRTVDYLPLPKFLGEIYVGQGAGKKIHICSTSGSQNSSGGHLYGIGEDGDLLLYLKDPVHICLEKDSDGPEPMAVTLEWKPDFFFLDSGKLTRPIYDIREQLMLGERLRWLGTQCARLAEPGYILVEDSVDLVKMASKDRRKLIPKILEQCKAIGSGDIGIAIWKAYDQLVNIFEGKTDFLDLVINDGTLSNVYNWANDMWDVSEFFQLLGHMQPQMKVLEIGAGTGGLTAKVLEHLRSSYGERLYLQYTFTDLSSGFFPAANKRFAEYQAIEYKVLDISRNPLEQGFQREEYDLIIASNVLHATPILHDTLVNVRTLLKPQGRLFLQELSPVGNSMGYIMGIFSGWWLGAADGRDGKPFISPKEWDTRLRSAGFNGCETVKFDNEKPYHLNANIVARPAIEVEYSRTITLLSGPSAIHPLALKVEILLQQKGYQTMHYHLGDEQHTIPDQDLISFLDLDQPFLKAPSEADWDQFLCMIGTLQQASVLWLLPLTQIKSNDPHTALILGVTRTIRSELAMPLITLEMESHASLEAAVAVVDVLNKLQQRNEDDGDLDPDMEYCWANGAVHVGRYHWYPVKKALTETAAEPATKMLRIGNHGLLQSLHWSGCALPELGADQVQIQTQAVGLNFKDVLVAMGVVDNASKDAIFGVEGAGYVSKTGANVDHLEEGDRVIYIGASTIGLATEVQRQGCFTLRIPDCLSFEDAATMSAAYVTVLLGVVEKARLEHGQSILIHAATGGVGIAAINVARWLGLDIYCTVGSERKVEFLVQEHAIPRDRIFHSRDTSFRDDIMATTNGVGVDCVLNSLSGELLHASWECVAASGCMIEIGKRDMIGRGQLALDRFEDNRTYIGIDLSRYIVTNPTNIMKLMKLMLHLYTGSHIRPIDPITLYGANEVQDAFRYMQQGSHIGKVVIKFPEDLGALRWSMETPTPSFKQDRAYLLVGGMGGLGRAIATWMVTHGARHLIFLSRSAGTSENDKMFIRELEAGGCIVQAWAGDVADPVTVKNAIQQAPVPIAGVMQMAMVLCDVGILDMSLEDYHTALKPKVDGTWNIHNALPNEYLDFFVMFSSVCGQMGYYGQANYAAANTFLDAFAQYRHSQGLKASVQDIGAINDVGFISQNPAVKASMQAGSTRLITEQDFLDTLQLTIAKSSSPSVSRPARMEDLGTGLVFHNPSQVTQMSECQLPIMHPENHIIWKRDPRMAIYRNIETTSTKAETTSNGLRSFLLEINDDSALLQQPAAAEFLARELRDRVSAFLMRQTGEEPLDLGLTLTDVGVDSLVAIEVRNWWKQNLGVEISVLELKNGGSMLDIGGLAAKKLREKLSSSA